MAKYVGFSTVERQSPPYRLTDIELVKRDLLNEFNTRLGERVMRPEYGTIIYDLLMDPADETTLNAIEQDAIRIVRKDPRVLLSEVVVTEHQDAILVQIDLLYGPQQIKNSLYITYQMATGADFEIFELN